MKLLITGICGFVGSTLATALKEERRGGGEKLEIIGIDNFSRAGSEINRLALRRLGIHVRHADLRCPEDIDDLPAADWVIDASAQASVLAGIDGAAGSRQLLSHNLVGTINLLEYCKRHRTGIILLSTSRVYSIEPLASLPVIEEAGRYVLRTGATRPTLPAGISPAGITESFATTPPISLYGASKLASETLILEYASSFGFPAWINRCGVMAGAGQFGRPDQGIFAYWLNSYLRRAPLKYIGFGGTGLQTRDAFHPRDLVPLLHQQFAAAGQAPDRIVNLGGGVDNAVSLAQVSDWCRNRFGAHPIAADANPRKFDVPWLVMDSSKAATLWNWRPQHTIWQILDEIATHAEAHPEWLEISA